MKTKKTLLIAGCILVLALSLFFVFKNIYRYQTVDLLGIEKINTRSNIITGTVYAQNLETMTWEPFEQAKKRIIEKRILAIVERTNAINKELNAILYAISGNKFSIINSMQSLSDKESDKLIESCNKLRSEKELLESERKKLKEQL